MAQAMHYIRNPSKMKYPSQILSKTLNSSDITNRNIIFYPLCSLFGVRIGHLTAARGDVRIDNTEHDIINQLIPVLIVLIVMIITTG
jgi:hypothetical protein